MKNSVIKKGSRIIAEVLTHDGEFKTKSIKIMSDMKEYIFLDILSRRHRAYTFYDILSD